MEETASFHLIWKKQLHSGGFQPDFLFRDYVTSQINVLLWISLISITALLLRKLTGILRLWTQAKLIPGPPCPSSFYGHSKLISGSNLTGEFVLSIFNFFVNNWLSGPACVSSQCPQGLEHYYIPDCRSYATRPNPLGSRIIDSLSQAGFNCPSC